MVSKFLFKTKLEHMLIKFLRYSISAAILNLVEFGRVVCAHRSSDVE